jgi:hypothetical protein
MRIKLKQRTVLLIFILLSIQIVALPIEERNEKSGYCPGRIIRTCCYFGLDVPIVGLPFVKFSQVSGVSELGAHKYLGGGEESNGIIYTRRGGFIDLGHVRDQADWTAYLFNRLTENINKKDTLHLAYEGGHKYLIIDLTSTISDNDLIIIAGRIAYDLAVWHEIATGFGTSAIPGLGEKYSSFSIEDSYSNMLGVQLGMSALESRLSYNGAMDSLIVDVLHKLEAVKSVTETREAFELVNNLWWTDDNSLPRKDVVLVRDFNPYADQNPYLLPYFNGIDIPFQLKYSSLSSSSVQLSEFYSINIELNNKFPVSKIFPQRENKLVSNQDFLALIDWLILEL